MIPVQRPCLGPEELSSVAAVFDSGWLGQGRVSAAFEAAVRQYIGCEHVVAVNTGTSALHLAFEAIEHDDGDEIIMPSLTFVATPQAALAAGFRPVFCEVRESDLNMDVDDALSRITPRTRAIVPVHYGGKPCDMDKLIAGARSHGVKIIDDAAHAFGSTYKGSKVGTLGDVTCFSFDPIKNITCGEGGAVATNDAQIAQRVATQRVLGIDRDAWSRRRTPKPWAYDVAGIGYRYHLPNVNAAMGLAQLEKLELFRGRKQAIVRRYDAALAGLDGLSLLERDVDSTFPFSYVVRVLGAVGRRDELMQHLREAGVDSGVHYIPNHLQPLFADGVTALPVTELVFDQIVTLPLFYGLTDEQVEQVIAAVVSFFKPRAATVVISAARVGAAS